MFLRKLALVLGLALASSPVLAGCAAETPAEEVAETDDAALTSVTSDEIAAAQRTAIPSDLTFDLLTPTATKIMKASHYWMNAQDENPRYPKARMCATNVSKVFRLSGIQTYDQEGVRNLIADVRGDGGEAYKMPQNKAGFIAKMNTIHGGHIPAGTVIAGMSIVSSNPGDQHVGFVAHTDNNGVIWIVHNNWYRPENENGARKDYMVSDANLRRGFPRQWMATPWMKITRDGSGKVVDVKSMLPALDDMDPLNATYQTTLTIPAEIVREL